MNFMMHQITNINQPYRNQNLLNTYQSGYLNNLKDQNFQDALEKRLQSIGEKKPLDDKQMHQYYSIESPNTQAECKGIKDQCNDNTVLFEQISKKLKKLAIKQQKQSFSFDTRSFYRNHARSQTTSKNDSLKEEEKTLKFKSKIMQKTSVDDNQSMSQVNSLEFQKLLASKLRDLYEDEEEKLSNLQSSGEKNTKNKNRSSIMSCNSARVSSSDKSPSSDPITSQNEVNIDSGGSFNMNASAISSGAQNALSKLINVYKNIYFILYFYQEIIFALI